MVIAVASPPHSMPWSMQFSPKQQTPVQWGPLPLPPAGPMAAAVAPRDASQLPPVSFTVPLSGRMTTRCHHGCPPSGGPFPPRLWKGLRGLAFPVTPAAVGEGDALPPAQGPEEAVSQETPPPPPPGSKTDASTAPALPEGPPGPSRHQRPPTATNRPTQAQTRASGEQKPAQTSLASLSQSEPAPAAPPRSPAPPPRSGCRSVRLRLRPAAAPS